MMIKRWFAALAAVSSVAAHAADAPYCAAIKSEDTRVFDAVVVGSAATAPVPLVRKKPAARERFDLVTRWHTLADNNLATTNGKFPPVPFRAFRFDGEQQLCTSNARDNLFGKPLPDPHFLLRCLIDADRDGRFEAYRARAELVPYNMRTGKQGKGSGTTPPVRPFSHPLTLVEAPGFKDPSAAFAPRIVAEVRVAELTADTAIIQRQMQVAMLPGSHGERFRDWADSERWTVPLREGQWTAPDGTQLILARAGKGWTAAAPKGWFAPPKLVCGNSVVELPRSIAILGETGMAVLKKPAS